MKLSDKEKQLLFEELNYRRFLQILLGKLLDEGQSYRAIARSAGIKSPNFLQQVVQGARELTPQGAAKLAKGLGLTGHEADYLIQIVRLSHPKVRDKEPVLLKLRELQNKFDRSEVRDVSIHSHWVNSVIFELCKIKNLRITADSVFQLVGGAATKDEIQSGIELLLKKEWIKPLGEQQYEQNGVEFQFLDGARRLDVQRNHLHYLHVAQHRINDDLKERSYRGLTVAIPAEKFEWIQRKIVEFYDELDKLCESYVNTDSIIRIQMASYFVVKPDLIREQKK